MSTADILLRKPSGDGRRWELSPRHGFVGKRLGTTCDAVTADPAAAGPAARTTGAREEATGAAGPGASAERTATPASTSLRGRREAAGAEAPTRRPRRPRRIRRRGVGAVDPGRRGTEPKVQDPEPLNPELRSSRMRVMPRSSWRCSSQGAGASVIAATPSAGSRVVGASSGGVLGHIGAAIGRGWVAFAT